MDHPHPHRPDPDDQAAGDLDPWHTGDLEDDPDDDLELGMPVYEEPGCRYGR